MGYRNTNDIPVPESTLPKQGIPRPTGITPRTFAVLKAIARLIKRKGYSPSLIEIGEVVGLSSTASIHRHLTSLELRGLVVRSYNHSRSIELTENGKKLIARIPA